MYSLVKWIAGEQVAWYFGLACLAFLALYCANWFRSKLREKHQARQLSAEYREGLSASRWVCRYCHHPNALDDGACAKCRKGKD